MNTLIAATVLAGSVALASCSDTARRDAASAGDTSAMRAESSQKVTAQMHDASGKDLGAVTLSDGNKGITLSGRLTGLPPGEHGIHLHAVGKCEGPKFTSAGDHWNPSNKEHGLKNPKGPHSGDMPNFTVGSDRTSSVDLASADGTLRGNNALLDGDGAAVVVHAKPDDYRTQPSGDSGDRIACGVIR